MFSQFTQFAEYLDENYEDLSGNNLLLESLLPAIKASVAQKSGTLLDEKTQYNIVGTSTEEMRVQCITSDGKEFEIEMVLDPTHERQALTVNLKNRNRTNSKLRYSFYSSFFSYSMNAMSLVISKFSLVQSARKHFRGEEN